MQKGDLFDSMNENMDLFYIKIESRDRNNSQNLSYYPYMKLVLQEISQNPQKNTRKSTIPYRQKNWILSFTEHI